MIGVRSQKAGLELAFTLEEDTACNTEFLLILEDETLDPFQRRVR